MITDRLIRALDWTDETTMDTVALGALVLLVLGAGLIDAALRLDGWEDRREARREARRRAASRRA